MNTRVHTKKDTTGSRSTALSVSNLSRIYQTNDGELKAVDNVSFEIKEQTIVGLLGPNGAGKTTIIKMIAGLLTPSSGTITINGESHSQMQSELHDHISVVLEGARNIYWQLTPLENFEFFASLQGIDPRTVRDDHVALLESFGLEDKANDPVQSLSRGMKQRVAIGCALVRDTPLIFLDEPTLGLDVEASNDLKKKIRKLAEEKNRTIILSSHNMDTVQEVCHEVIILNDGKKIVDDTVANLINIFQSISYEITINERVDDDVYNRIDGEFDIVEWEVDSNQTRFVVSLMESKSVYKLVSIMEHACLDLDDISSTNIDLEHIFVKTIEGENE